MAEQDTGPGRAARGTAILVVIGAAALLWAAGKIVIHAGRSQEPAAPVPPPYALDGSPPWTWPRPASAGADIWAVSQWQPAYQPWPPEWMNS